MNFFNSSNNLILNDSNLSCGKDHSCLSLKNGNVRCYGSNKYEQSKLSIQNLNNNYKVIAGWNSTCQINKNGILNCHGEQKWN